MENININLDETIEKHNKLNPKLFDNDNILYEKVRAKLLEIVDLFLDSLSEDNIKIILKDVLLIGSNASYNYTDNSDIDLHIVADTASLHCPDNLYPLLYSAYRSLFNKKYDISIYGIPVELYIETEDVKTKSNGIYSVKNNEWIKEPELLDIPEINQTEIDKKVATWSKRINKLIDKAQKDTTNLSLLYKTIEDLINAIYDLRKQSISAEGEYGIGNLVFKELRNNGLLDKLKETKEATIEKQLTLESLKEELTWSQLSEYRNEISRLANMPVLMQENGMFSIHNIKELNVNYILNKLLQLDFIEYANKDSGRYDWGIPVLPFQKPAKIYTIAGKIKD